MNGRREDELTLSLQRLAGIVVTYRPDRQVIENLAALRSQVGELIVVDNSEETSAEAMLEEAGTRINFRLIANRENLGIAAALNIGIRRAIELGCEWLLLFDQDSCVTPGFTQAMLKTYATLSATQPLGILVPRYADRSLGLPLPPARLDGSTLATAMTSGSLLSSQLFQACGPFVEQLFIDGVDHEYSLRVRHAGYVIRDCDTALLLHSLGTPRLHSLLGLIKFQSTNYVPLRRYYQERNKIWIYRHYGRRFTGFCSAMCLRSLIELAKILLVESDKARKCRFFFRGIYDGLRGRMGKLIV